MHVLRAQMAVFFGKKELILHSKCGTNVCVLYKVRECRSLIRVIHYECTHSRASLSHLPTLFFQPFSLCHVLPSIV